jgi:hypothetical protein
MNADDGLTRRSKVQAGAGGIGGGTLFVVIGNSLPAGNWAKPYLYWAAPSASVTLTAVWIWVQAQVPVWIRGYRIWRLVRGTKKDLRSMINNPDTSVAHREEMKRKLEELERDDVSAKLKQLESLRVVQSGTETVAEN